MNVEFSRQPRFLPDIPGGEIEVPNPPTAYDKPEISWFTLLAPPVVMLIITGLIAMTSQSMFLILSIATTIMTLIISLSNAASQIKKYKKKKKEREKKYTQFIADKRSELSIAKEQQTKALNEMNPDPAKCIQRIESIDNKLWERTPSHNDFLSLRLGIGTTLLNKKINYTKQAIIMESDPLIMEPQRLALDFERISNVPISVNLIESEICGIAGEPEKTIELAKLMLLQLITHHGYDDIRIVILSSEENLEQWSFMKYLPHIWDDSFDVRFLTCGKVLTHQTLPEIYHVLKQREAKGNEGNVFPYYVFIVEDASLLENEPINRYLYNGASKLGVSTIFTAQNSAYLPMNCKTVITFSGKSAQLISKSSSEKTIFSPDTLDSKKLELACRKLSTVRIKNTSANFSLPATVTLLDAYRIKKVDEIDVASLWDKNKTFKGMSVPIGVKIGNALFNLDMHETGHGPHGLVAGTTGSGKSEILQSIIISLAMNYHPHDVVFVLIDYKGGGMADVFKGMPHLVGTITNLGGNQTNRALLSIKSELLRRQRIFSECGVNNIDKYQKLYYNSEKNKGMIAIPHLIMIADEFAELKQDQPDFMKELVSTARVGRSLGVHLILATQKPAGVVDDQIWSNSKFKLCLKVQDEADSKDVIKRPDAAMIKEPGRAYIQVGNDEIFEMFQSMYSGADYDPNGEIRKSSSVSKKIFRLSLNGKKEQIYPLEEEKIVNKDLPSQLEAMVKHITEMASQSSIEPLDGPWLQPLPEMIHLDSIFSEVGIIHKTSDLLSATVGIVDDPRGQSQEFLKIDFAKEGNLIIYGASSTGKTNLLKTICLSLAHNYTPSEVNLYVMDFGGTAFKSFENLPHCGGVMTLEQDTKINQFMLFIYRLIDERKALFEQTNCDSFNAYRNSGKMIPGIVILIDNYLGLSETYEMIDDQIIKLSREGMKYGIYLVVTAVNTASIRYKFSVNFKMAISYQMIEKSEYNEIVGRTEGLEPAKVTGRGLVRAVNPLEFQTALCEFKNHNTEQVIEMLNNNITERAVQIPVMPTTVDIEKINTQKDRLAIGISDNNLQPICIDFAKIPAFMIAGEAMSGKSTILMSWIKVLKDATFYVLDSKAMGLYNIMNLPNVNDLAQLSDSYASIIEILDKRNQELVDCKKNNGNIQELINSWKQIIFVIDSFAELNVSGNYALMDLLERVIRDERNSKVSVIVSETLSEYHNIWNDLGKRIKDEQVGILIGSMKEQQLFTSVRLPYGVQEKELELGDGYIIMKNKYEGLRLAISQDGSV